MIPEKTINSLEMLVSEVKHDYVDWGTSTFPWFRGEPEDITDPLVPRVYRANHNENRLLQHFRMKAPTLGLLSTPPRAHTDEWLFLAQHVGLPTRLLDWTEGLLVALYFAVHILERGAVVWMLDPVELNKQSAPPGYDDNEFPLTWFSPENVLVTRWELVSLLRLTTDEDITDKSSRLERLLSDIRPNVGHLNVRGAWERDQVGTELPVAIHPTNIHPRMSTQKSCFTIHGMKKDSLASLVGARLLRKYIVAEEAIDSIKFDLQMMGITYSSLFPDLDGLARDLGAMF